MIQREIERTKKGVKQQKSYLCVYEIQARPIWSQQRTVGCSADRTQFNLKITRLNYSIIVALLVGYRRRKNIRRIFHRFFQFPSFCDLSMIPSLIFILSSSSFFFVYCCERNFIRFRRQPRQKSHLVCGLEFRRRPTLYLTISKKNIYIYIIINLQC